MASLPVDPTDAPFPHAAVAHALLSCLRSNEPIGAGKLRRMFEAATGGSDACGAWSMRLAYDALELAQTLFLLQADCPLLAGSAGDVLAGLEALAARLPVHSCRSEQQIALQQFSTPLALAWLAGVAARPIAGELLLEPSAGNGLLAAPVARAGLRLALNEIDEVRRASLTEAFPQARVTGHDGELIDDLLPPAVRPSVIVMNPPFARSEGRGVDRHAATRNLRAALARLASGGRLVALMPASFDDAKSGQGLTRKAGADVCLLLNLLLSGHAFSRHGTGIAVRLVVFDKIGDAARPVAGEAERLVDVLARLEALPERQRLSPAPPPPPPPRPPGGGFILFGRTAPARPPQPLPSGLCQAGAAQPLAYSVMEQPAPTAGQVGIYLPYRPSRIAIAGALEHPTPLVESLAMGSIAAPAPAYAPLLPPRLVENGLLSEPQLETLIYAGTAFERNLPGRFRPGEQGCELVPSDGEGEAYRCGYFLGDGTGAGKGRQIAGIILDQWLRGNRRHIWLSKNESLLEDARRDWAALGGLPLDVQPLSQWKLEASLAMDAGILFVTYPTLRSGRADATRLQQIVQWAGSGFEGVVALDEAHALANAAGGEGSRGRVKGSEQGIAGLRLQNLLPRARVLYASATGASDVNNLAYAMRLGLWGPETAFADRAGFVAAIRAGGIAAMELVARDLKALGLYGARALSFAGVEYELLEHALTADQISVYDAYADAWAVIHAYLAEALEATRVVDGATGTTLNANARSAALSRFEGTKQRFFGQLLLSMKLPSLVPAIEADLAAGRAIVVQLVSTAEAMLDRRLADLSPEEREALQLDLSPREHVVDYLRAAFPTRQMRVFTDAEGNVRSEPMSDGDGRPVHCQAALRRRDALVEQLCALPPISTALDTLIERFGTEAVAEVTGRTRRLVVRADGRQKLENRSARANLAETDAFMRGTKRILIFSDAGGTGRSYHACLGARNQARRVHYLLEPGWRADAAIQGLGRTHRTRQASAPLFRPVTTDVRGERRFISTIARRLDALGALTRGQRQTGGQNLFDPADNLESAYARDALTSWYRLLHAGKLKSTTFGRFQELTGLRLEADGGSLREDLPPIQRWLNRILALRILLQNAIFDEFLGLVEARVAAARDAGTLDVGVETVPVDSFEILDDRVIHTDPRSGATTHLLRVELVRRLKPVSLERLTALAVSRPDAVPMVNGRSGKVALRLNARSLTSEEGLPIARYELIRPLKHEHVQRDRLEETSWVQASDQDFARSWAAEVREAEATVRRERVHLATGLLLAVWDKLPDEQVQVVRVAAGDGRSLLGREIPAFCLGELAHKLGLDLPPEVPPAELAATVMRSGKPLPFRSVEELTLKRSLVNGSQRLELSGFAAARLPWYKSKGCFTEIIRYQTRLFVPVDRAAGVLAGLAIDAGPRTRASAARG